MSKSFILKFEKSAAQELGGVKRVVGLVSGKAIIRLIDSVGLSANPRSAKTGSVTAEIIASLEEAPDLFPFKTKGILLGTAGYRALERQRYELSFEDSEVEGVLDGGHNCLAIALHILRCAGLGERELKSIRTWDTLKDVWVENRQRVDAVKETLDFLVPVELLVPLDLSDIENVEQFTTSLLDICAARNNNVQLTEETKANKKGFYEEIRNFLPEDLADKVEWKTNDGGRIKVRDLIALAWVPLSILKLPDDIRVNPNQIYRNKAVCVSAFNNLMSHEGVTKPIDGGYSHQLHNKSIKSAFKILSDLPKIYDQLFSDIPDAYNRAGGKFGSISAVKMYDATRIGDKNPRYLKRQPVTPFYRTPVSYTCPDGFLVPLLFGLRALLIERDGIISWKIDPKFFLKNNLVEIMKSFKFALEMAAFDPQTVGKNISAYDFAEAAISAQLAKSKLSK